MARKTTFGDICNRLAARQCFNAWQSVKQISASAMRTTAVIRKWLKDTGLHSTRRRK